MFESLKRMQLKRKGLSCGRTRRKQSDNALTQLLWENPWIKAVIFLGFFAGMISLVIYSPSLDTVFGRNGLQGSMVVAVMFVAALTQFYLNHPNSFQENGRVLLVFGAILLNVALVWVVANFVQTRPLPLDHLFLLTPYAFAPMLVSVVLGRQLGVFAAVCATLFGVLMVNSAQVLLFIVLSLIVSIAGVYVTHQIRRRSRLVRAGFSTGFLVLVLGLPLGYIDVSGFADLSTMDWQSFGIRCLIPIGVGVGTATVIGGILPMVESVFRLTTAVSWIELSDLNHPLLRRMTLEAPGTYHHSLVVANLSEAAAEKIGCNAVMCRVCAYFHDIGKLVKPEYFIENIAEGENPHDDLTPNMSVLIIMAHVKDGVDLAIKNKMNNAIIDVIEEHHGTSLIYFFYRRALDQKEEIERLVEEGKANEEDIPEVAEDAFRYSGPTPSTRESGIISLADAVEGASRSMQKPTPVKIRQMVDEIVRSRVRDGQLDECDLTLHELADIKDSFCETLRSMLHNRISYPKEKTEHDDARKEERRTQGKAVEEKRRKSAATKEGKESKEAGRKQVAESSKPL